MQNPEIRKNRKAKLISGFSVIIISIISLVFTILLTYVCGDKILYHNSLKVLSIMSSGILIFTTIGLYYGIKLKNDFRHEVYQNLKLLDISSGEVSNLKGTSNDLASAMIGAVVILALALILSFLLSLFASFVWVTFIALFFVIYWIFYRSIKVILKNAKDCKGNFFRSFSRSFSYTIIYSVWFYGILFLLNYLEVI